MPAHPGTMVASPHPGLVKEFRELFDKANETGTSLSKFTDTTAPAFTQLLLEFLGHLVRHWSLRPLMCANTFRRTT